MATPFPVAFVALGIASLMTAGRQLGWFPAHDLTVSLVLIVFAFPLQAIGSVFGFLARDTVAATGFAVQGATWLMLGIVGVVVPATTDPALGLFLIAAGGGIALCVVGASLGKLMPAAVLGLTGVRFALTGVYELGAGTGVQHVAAIVGLAIVPLAAYASLALEVENLERRTVLPLGRRGAGAAALTRSLAEQDAGIAHEAGVREQL